MSNRTPGDSLVGTRVRYICLVIAQMFLCVAVVYAFYFVSRAALGRTHWPALVTIASILLSPLAYIRALRIEVIERQGRTTHQT